MKHIAAALIAVLLTGCTATTAGEAAAPSAVMPGSDPSVTTTTSAAAAAPAPVDAAPPQYRSMLDRTNEIMTLAASWWDEQGADGMPLSVVWDADLPCDKNGENTPAWTCKRPPTVAVYPPALDRRIYTPAGVPGLTLLIGHEAAHLGQRLVDSSMDTDDDAEELRADCFAGAFQSHLIAEGDLTETQALRSVGILFKGKDSRMHAWGAGYTSGASACWEYTR